MKITIPVQDDIIAICGTICYCSGILVLMQNLIYAIGNPYHLHLNTNFVFNVLLGLGTLSFAIGGFIRHSARYGSLPPGNQ